MKYKNLLTSAILLLLEKVAYGFPRGSLQPHLECQESQNFTLVKAGVALWSVKLTQGWMIKLTVKFGVNMNPIQEKMRLAR